MPIRVKLPNGQYGNFPDDMPHEQIEEVLRKQFPTGVKEESLPQKSFLSSIKDQSIDALKGAGIGLFQGLSDTGANISQLPGDIYSYVTGKPSYKSPRPSFREYAPESSAGQAAESIGEFVAPFGLPGIAGSAIGTKLLPRALAGSAIGAAESENRPLGAILGGIGGVASELPIRKVVGAKYLNKVEKELKSRGVSPLKVPEEIFEDIIQNKFLSNTSANRRLLEKARQGEYKDLFSLQSDLGQRERAYLKDVFSAANRQFGRDIGETRRGLLNEMRSLISQQGHEDLAKLLSHGQNRYRQYMKLRPYMIGAGGLVASTQLPYYKQIKQLLGQ